MTRWPKLLILGLLALVGASAQDSERYRGHAVFRAYPSSDVHVRFLQKLAKDYQVDIWREAPGREYDFHGMGTDIQVPGHLIKQITHELRNANLKHDKIIEDIHNLLPNDWLLQGPIAESDKVSFSQYNRLNTIYSWMSKLHTGQKIIVESIGKSYEGRDLNIIKIGETVSNLTAKTPVIWIDAGIHAREWIAPAVAVYVIDQLVKDVQRGGNLTKRFNWYILPVMNTDGYEYTHTTNRLWRKNRNPVPNTRCIGADLNRNFDFKWASIGVSRNPCSNIFCGTRPSSEPETQAVSNYIIEHQANFKVFLTLHSYGQLWLTPWGYTKDFTEDHQEIKRVGEKAIQALYAVNGTQYTVGSSAHILYQSSGTSRDWAKGVPKIPYVYTVELRDKGGYGFLLPATYIQPTAVEFWAAVQAMANDDKVMSG